jgi:hypothetical protein
MMKQLTRQEAVEYWGDPSQQLYGLTLEDLPEPGFMQYFAVNNLAAMVHASWWPGVYMFHIGVKPEGRGNLREESLELLNGVTDYYGAQALTTWVPSDNRAARAMAVRTGLTLDGVTRLNNLDLYLFSWRKGDKECQQQP